jgi:hypothetical protein
MKWVLTKPFLTPDFWWPGGSGINLRLTDNKPVLAYAVAQYGSANKIGQ